MVNYNQVNIICISHIQSNKNNIYVYNIMGLYCKQEDEAKEIDDYNQNTYGNTYTNQNNNEDIF